MQRKSTRLTSLATQTPECQLTFAQNAIYLRIFQHSQENEIDDKSFVRLPRQYMQESDGGVYV